MTEPTDSILLSTKQNLQLEGDYKDFDPDVIMHINSALAELNQVGVGPANGFEVTGDTETWLQLLGAEPRLNAAKTYVYLYVKQAFDPPTTSFVLESNAKIMDRIIYRLNMFREEQAWPSSTTS